MWEKKQRRCSNYKLNKGTKLPDFGTFTFDFFLIFLLDEREKKTNYDNRRLRSFTYMLRNINIKEEIRVVLL